MKQGPDFVGSILEIYGAIQCEYILFIYEFPLRRSDSHKISKRYLHDNSGPSSHLY